MLRDHLERARLSLLGLALGDALGSQFFVPGNHDHLSSRSLPPAPWQWTDDTEMACSVYLTLAIHHTVDQDALAASFARRHDFDRGYGPATNRLLRLVRDGGDWRTLAAGQLYRRGECRLPAREPELQPRRPAVDYDAGVLDAEHGMRFPQVPELLVTCGIGGKKRHVARLPAIALYKAAFAGAPPWSW